MKTQLLEATERELAHALMLLQDDGRENLSAENLEIVEAYDNDAIRIIQDAPADRCGSVNYAGGGYARDSRGNYREAFWAGLA